MVKINSQGYDNPISLRQGDHLNRWSFAREIFSIADTAPSSWSVRIGVYGGWGTGKTSVLKFIESMAKAKSHVVVNFNPWSYRTTDEMWEELTTKVYQALKNTGLEMVNHKTTMLRPFVRKIANVASTNADTVDELAKYIPASFSVQGLTKTTKFGLSVLTNFLKANSQQLEKVNEVLGEKRIIVLIDDLDRTDLRLLPEVLYALREVLDLPGFIFIMGFDPIIVGQALKVNHPGWGNGKQFLEKIIDFPRPLPSPTGKQLLELAKNDLNIQGNFIDLNVFENIFDFLPKNPRRLRSFLRSLWGIKPQIARYDDTEINWETLLLINLLKFKQPELTYYLFEQDDQYFVNWGVSRFSNNNPEQALNRQTKVKEQFHKICKEVGLNDGQEQEKCFDIIDAIVTKNIFGMDVVAMKQLAFFTESPPVLTLKEVNIALGIWISTNSSNSIREFISEHAVKIELDYDLVFAALFEKLVVSYEKQLLEASNTSRDEKRKDYVKQAENICNLLSILSFDLKGFTSESPQFGVEHFLLILRIAKAYIDIKNTPEYQKLRKLERNLLEKITTETTLDPVLLLEAISPWKNYREDTLSQNISLYSQLKKDLSCIIEAKASEELIKNLKTKDLSEKSEILVHLILRHQSALWESTELRQNILNLASNADTSFLIQQNLLKLFQLFADELGERSFQITQASDNMVFDLELLHNIDVIDELWKGALATSLNFSVINYYENYRKVIQQYIDVKLTIPDTWRQHLSLSENR